VNDFATLVTDLDYPMFIVTTAADGRRAGCLIGFATQTSIHPPRFLACLSRKNYTYRVAQRAEMLAVHFVPADAAILAGLFGGETGDEVDKFARVDWTEGPGGVPLLDDCTNRFVGRVVERYDLGDHAGFLLDPFHVDVGVPTAEFSFHRAKRIEPGHEP
jgi:flavin reductase (DIM6/NTAB) family NADH-FMN oxidoreductase RutF